MNFSLFADGLPQTILSWMAVIGLPLFFVRAWLDRFCRDRNRMISDKINTYQEAGIYVDSSQLNEINKKAYEKIQAENLGAATSEEELVEQTVKLIRRRHRWDTIRSFLGTKK